MGIKHIELFNAARRAVTLPQLWRDYGHDVVVRSNRCEVSYTPCCGQGNRRDCGSLFIRRSDSTWNYHCFRCGKGGSCIDFLVHVEGLTAIQAANRLLKVAGGYESIMGRPASPPAPKIAPEAQRKALRRVLAFLQDERLPGGVVDYLHKERHLSKAVIQEAYNRGILRGLPTNPENADTTLRLGVGDQVLLDAGLLKPDGRRCAAAYRPVIFIPPGGALEVKSTRGGTPKAIQYGRATRPLIWMPEGTVTRVIVVEGGVDLLSMVDLGFGRSALMLGVLGASAFKDEWVQAIKDRFGPVPWELSQDDDDAGNTSAASLAEVCASLNLECERIKPFFGLNDWNNVLEAAVLGDASKTSD